MTGFSFKRTIFNGIALALPLAVILYVFLRIISMLEKGIGPVAKKLEIDTLFGEFTLSIIAIFLILVIVFILGLLMLLPLIASFRRYIEGWILRLVPSLNHLKVIAAEKLQADNATVQWKPVFVFRLEQQEFFPGYIIEENEEWITLSFANIPSTEPGQVLITRKSAVKYKEITMKDMAHFNRQFGKGYLSLIDSSFKFL